MVDTVQFTHYLDLNFFAASPITFSYFGGGGGLFAMDVFIFAAMICMFL